MRVALSALMVALLIAPAWSQEPPIVQRIGPAALRTNAVFQKDVVVLAFTDVLELVIEVVGDAALDVRPPTVWAQAPWQIRAATPVERMESGKMVWTQKLTAEPLQPGELALALAPLRYRLDGGDWQTIAWKPIAVRVTPHLTQPDLKSVRDITAIEELPPAPVRSGPIQWIVAGAIGAALALVAAVLMLRRRQKARIRLAPEAWALYELKRLQALQLPERGKHERFGTLLAGLVRQYLENRYALPARRQTTSEFLAMLDQHKSLGSHREFLGAFLRRCDLLKFAPIEASVDECRNLADQARQFLTKNQTASTVSLTSAAVGETS